jgi:hypothetical protein
MGLRRSAVVLTSVVAVSALAFLSRPHGAVQAADLPAPVAASPATPAAPIPAITPESEAAFQTKVTPLLVQNCYECHGNGNHKGDVALDSFKTVADVEKSRGQWEEVLRDVSSGDMPIMGAKHKPTDAERTVITEWIERQLYHYDPAHPYPGRVTLHRLNRSEYNNTIRDLLAIDFRPADAFPVDDAGYGFDNNGDVLSIAPVLMEKYIEAANQSLDKAIYADPVVPAPVVHWDGATMPGSLPPSDPNAALIGNGPTQRKSLLGRVFNYNAEIHEDYNFPKDGTYVFRMNGYGKQRPAVQFQVDGVDVGKPVLIAADLPNSAVYGTDPVKVSAGKHRVTLVFAGSATKAEYDAALAIAATRPAATQPANAGPGRRGPGAGAAGFAGAGAGGAGPGGAGANGAGPGGAGFSPAGGAGAGGAGGLGAPATQPGQRVRPPSTQPGLRGAATQPGGLRGAATQPGAGARGAAGRGRPPAGARGARGGAPQTITGKSTMGVVYVEVEGPEEITPDRMPESYRKVMIVEPSATVTKRQAAEQIVRVFASRAFRRPVDSDELSRLMALWTKEDASGVDFLTSIHSTLQAVLVSPYFLYRFEQDPTASDPDGVRSLDEYELASRLSYFLWSSMPDDELFKLASEGKLRANLETEVRRMMKDPKSSAMVENFAGQWLQLRQLANVSPDPMRFPDFDEPLRAAMLKETQLFFSSIMTQDRSVLDFIDSNYTFLNERLAKHYGIPGVTGDDFRQVTLMGNERGGLLTQASILTVTSYTNRTSPVQRGKWVLENLLDAAPPPPPPDVPKLVETAQAELTGTLRERMEKHRTNPNCVTCHAQMDPIGFGLENYDATGAWREKDINNMPIDATGTLPDGSNFNGASGLKEVLMTRKDQFCRCLTSRLMTYALGRGLEIYDKPTEEQISINLAKNDYKFSNLVMQIVESDAFQKRGAKRGDQ